MQLELRNLRRLFVHALASSAVIGCGDEPSVEPSDASSAPDCLGTGYPAETTIVPYVAKCVDASSTKPGDQDAGRSSDAGDDATSDGGGGSSSDVGVGGDDAGGAADGGPSADAGTNDDGTCIEEPINCYDVCAAGSWSSSVMVSCREVPAPTGSRNVECTLQMPCGRKTAGQPTAPVIHSDVGSWLAAAAFIEAGSIDAFERLADELRRHGAPRSLIREARRSARDEVRHARIIERLTRKHGSKPIAPQRASLPRSRTLVEVALENAREGCVRETFGALIALHQARYAHDREMRAAMRTVARDETRHAALAWSIDRWIEKRVSPGVRRRIERARRAEIEKLAAELRDPPAAHRRALGVPGARRARSMLVILAQGLQALSS
jgi:hypothetical protein